MLVGFIDGDGYISITKIKEKYIKISLVISLDIKDISILEYIKSVLNIGTINTYPKSGEKNTCKLVISKIDLQEVLFPLLLHHHIFFLTEVRDIQYRKALFIIQHKVKLFSDLNKLVLSNNLILNHVINFFSFSGNHSLLGQKLLSYQK